jgi:hypothetical protein
MIGRDTEFDAGARTVVIPGYQGKAVPGSIYPFGGGYNNEETIT